MKKQWVLNVIPVIGLLVAFKSQAAPVTLLPDEILQIAIDTSSIAGTTGSIDIQFNPGPNSVESASVVMSRFQGATSTFDQQTGSVTGGPLPNPIALTNSTVFNEDLEGLSFGNALLFTLDFSGVAINNPTSQKPQSGSTFTVGLFSDPNATIPSSIDPGGVALTANISASGQFTTVLNSPQASITPEPAYLPLVLLVVLGLWSMRRKTGAHARQLLLFCIAGALLSGSNQLFAQSCNLSSLGGSYAGTVAGHTPNGTPVAYEAIAHFDSKGGNRRT